MLLVPTVLTVLTNTSIIFNISCLLVIVFTLNQVPEQFKNVTVKCVLKLYPLLHTSTLIEFIYVADININICPIYADLIVIHETKTTQINGTFYA